MRFQRLDILRGIAIVLMVLFHLNYSLVNIFGIEFLNFSEIFWYILGKISAIGFITIAGISFFLAEKKYGKDLWKKYWKYSVVLGVFAGSISFVTYFSFPEQYISFGILHFFALSFFLLPFFASFRDRNILLGLSIIIYGIYFIPLIENQYLYPLGFLYPGFSSADYYPLIPYFGVLLLGYSFALVLERFQKLNIFQGVGEENILEKFLRITGRNSLLIYLVHQPIIIGILFLGKFIGGSF